MTRQEYECAINANINTLTEGIAQLVRDCRPLPEDSFHDVAIIEYGGCTLVVGGDYESPCDQWPGGFDVCSIRVEDSRTNIFDLFSAVQIKTIGDKCYWSLRNDVDALMAASK